MTKDNKDKDSYQEEINALKAELESIKGKKDKNNLKEQKIFCSNCNAEVKPGSKYCTKCGSIIGQNNKSNITPNKDRLSSAKSSTVNDSLSTQPSQYSESSWDEIKSKRTTAGIFGIIFGFLGVHKFILGYKTEGFILLGISVIGGILTCGASIIVTDIIGIIEGIIILTKTPEEFKRLYIDKKTSWF